MIPKTESHIRIFFEFLSLEKINNIPMRALLKVPLSRLWFSGSSERKHYKPRDELHDASKLNNILN